MKVTTLNNVLDFSPVKYSIRDFFFLNYTEEVNIFCAEFP